MKRAASDLPQLARDPFIRHMAAICLLGLGGFLLWAGLVPLEEGIVASGAVVVENERKVVQHLEGGIVSEIRVIEGSRVEAGDVLVVLQQIAPLAGRDQVIQQVAALSASVARLSALKSGAGSPDFSVIERLNIGDGERAQIIRREQDLFEQQREALEADIVVLRTRRQGALTSASLKVDEIETTRRGLAAAQEELSLMQELVDQQLGRRNEVTRLQRSVAALESSIARLHSEQEAARALAEDLSVQIRQRQAQFSQEISNQLRTVNADLQSAEENLSAAEDVLSRSVIRAPVSGEVLNLELVTRGGVVRPGDTVMEIVPTVESVTASVRVRPVDRASVYKGQSVRTRITAYQSWVSPSLEGEITGVSADLKTDPATGAAYFEARLTIPPESLAEARGLDIHPGMPVEAFIFSGTRRTTLDYLLAPIMSSLFKGLRTQ